MRYLWNLPVVQDNCVVTAPPRGHSNSSADWKRNHVLHRSYLGEITCEVNGENVICYYASCFIPWCFMLHITTSDLATTNTICKRINLKR